MEIDVWQLYGPFNSYSRAVYAELVPPVGLSTDWNVSSM